MWLLDDYFPLPEPSYFEQPLTTTLSNMVNITSYAVNVHPLSKAILDIMDLNNINLKKIVLGANQNKCTQQEFRLINSSTSASTLETLEITNNRFVDFDTMIFPLSLNRLAHLKNLTIRSGGTTVFLVHVLQNLITFDTLVFNNLNISAHDETVDTQSVQQCGLKILKIFVLSFYDNKSELIKFNRTFEFVLQSCPLLEQFKLSGVTSLNLSSVLNLSFLHHSKIKVIGIDLPGCSFYIFNEMPGQQSKRWLSLNDDLIIEKGDYGGVSRFHINLAWKGQIKLELAECG